MKSFESGALRVVGRIGHLLLIWAAAFHGVYAVFPYFYVDLTLGGGVVLAFVPTILLLLIAVFVSGRVFRLIGELSRLIAVPVAGWRFVSFRFGKARGSRCLLDPPPLVNGECSCVCYLLCHGLSLALLGLILILLGFPFPEGAYFLRFFGLLAIAFAWRCLYPGVYGGTGNDGLQLLRLKKDPRWSAVIWLIRRVTVDMERAATFGDFSEETVNALMDYRYTDPSRGEETVLMTYRAAILFDRGEVEAALAVYQEIADSAAPELLKGRAYNELLYGAILRGASEEELKLRLNLVNASISRTRAPDSTGRRRVMLALRLLIQKDETRAEEEYDALLALAKNAPFRAQAALDLREAKRVREIYRNEAGSTPALKE
ncbi:MAG: hypothetical protein NC084_05030 [Bacteroides sp.]|nr:hypothetical protein [Eubacterium sp.]MCM1418464.1 hypothetical protein [Roseburia sp.]MCM1462060.1 hypothetical protein [Bacteroides sp.]